MSLTTGNNNNMAAFPTQNAITSLDLLKLVNLQSTLKHQNTLTDSFTSLPLYYDPVKKVKRDAVSETFLGQARYPEALLTQNSDSGLRIPQYLSGTQQQQSILFQNQLSNTIASNLQNTVQSNNLMNSLLIQNKLQELQKVMQQSVLERQQTFQARNLGLLNSGKIFQNNSNLVSMPQVSQFNQLFPANGNYKGSHLINNENSSVEKILNAQNFIFPSNLDNQVNVKRSRERSSSPQRQQQSSEIFAKKVSSEVKEKFFNSHEKILDMETSSTSSKTAETTSESLSPHERSDRFDVKFLAEEFEGLSQLELDEFIISLEKKVNAKVINKKRIAELLNKFNNCTKQILENVRKNKSYYRTQLC